MTERLVVSIAGAARLMGVRAAEVDRLIGDGDQLLGLPIVRMGSRVLIPRQPLVDVLSGRIGRPTAKERYYVQLHGSKHRVASWVDEGAPAGPGTRTMTTECGRATAYMFADDGSNHMMAGPEPTADLCRACFVRPA